MAWLFAKLYDRMTRRSEEQGLREWRRALLADVRGDVLEIGAGTGWNLPLYPTEDVRLRLTEPDPHMLGQLAKRLRELGRTDVKLELASGDKLPVPDASIDVVVSGLVFCTVADPVAVLAEVRRVLRPGGRLLLIEHVAHADERVRKWQRRIEPFWRWFAHGCRLTRDTAALVEQNGFVFEQKIDGELPAAPFWVRPAFRGVARRAG